jgi:hypothetical protein
MFTEFPTLINLVHATSRNDKSIMIKRKIFGLVCLVLFFPFKQGKAQSDHFAYVVTAVNKGGKAWIALRTLDTRTGAFSGVLMNLRDHEQQGTTPDSSVAAIAYDRKANRLYYAPMNIDQLRYIDLNTMNIFTVPGQYFSKTGKYEFVNAGPINRMVIAPDDFGYTITNDGNHLLRFSTHGSPVLADLGDLIDDPHNKEMTIHSICSNSGGDLVADDAGHLLLVTGSNKVYSVDITSRSTTYLATISGLPQRFTTSGVAVTEDGRQLLVSSSTYPDGNFFIDPETWTSSPAPTTNDLYESADLANSNVLITKTGANADVFIGKNPDNLNRVRIFPNPVLDDLVNVQFNELGPGTYTIQLINAVGKSLIEQKAKITSPAQTEFLHLAHYTAQGFYYVRILDEKNNVVSTQKLVVERW